MLFTIGSKTIKYLGIKLTTEVSYLYAKIYNALMKEIEEDTNGKIYLARGLQELTWLKCPHYPKQSTDLIQCIPKFQ